MKTLFSSILVLSVVLLSGCAAQPPMTEEDQAAEYGLTVEQFRAEKRAAARMNMNLEEHMKMLGDEQNMNGMNN